MKQLPQQGSSTLWSHEKKQNNGIAPKINEQVEHPGKNMRHISNLSICMIFLGGYVTIPVAQENHPYDLYMTSRYMERRVGLKCLQRTLEVCPSTSICKTATQIPGTVNMGNIATAPRRSGRRLASPRWSQGCSGCSHEGIVES